MSEQKSPAVAFERPEEKFGVSFLPDLLAHSSHPSILRIPVSEEARNRNAVLVVLPISLEMRRKTPPRWTIQPSADPRRDDLKYRPFIHAGIPRSCLALGARNYL